MLVDVDIDDKHPDNIEAWPRVVISERRRVQALATHVERALVYFSDTISGAVYRTRRDEWEATELTVQQPHVEGVLLICCWSEMRSKLCLWVLGRITGPVRLYIKEPALMGFCPFWFSPILANKYSCCCCPIDFSDNIF